MASRQLPEQGAMPVNLQVKSPGPPFLQDKHDMMGQGLSCYPWVSLQQVSKHMYVTGLAGLEMGSQSAASTQSLTSRSSSSSTTVPAQALERHLLRSRLHQMWQRQPWSWLETQKLWRGGPTSSMLLMKPTNSGLARFDFQLHACIEPSHR